jgi:hypothetical protein
MCLCLCFRVCVSLFLFNQPAESERVLERSLREAVLVARAASHLAHRNSGQLTGQLGYKALSDPTCTAGHLTETWPTERSSGSVCWTQCFRRKRGSRKLAAARCPPLNAPPPWMVRGAGGSACLTHTAL